LFFVIYLQMHLITTIAESAISIQK